MKRILPTVVICALLFAPDVTCFSKANSSNHEKKMGWWVNDRFGMFIHWGIYSVPAKGEWYMTDDHVPRARYGQYAKEFDPVDFNADRWVKVARDAGMKYLVITSKHHDGFCMFDTKATKYNVVDATPWHTDPLKALSEACKKYGVRFCVYYSIMDWHSPDQSAYDPDPVHPTYNPTHFKPGKKEAYIRYMESQLKELITQYHPGVIWFDGGWMDGWTKEDGQEIYDYLCKLDPDIIVNNRAGVGDYETPEQYIPPNGMPGHDWETCMTINNNWGYNASDVNFKSARTLIQNLVDIASKGGNYLLNIGPTAKGIIPQPEVDRLEAMGRWLKGNGNAIYGSNASPFTIQLAWGRCTSKKGKLYLEVFDWPKDGKLLVTGLNSLPTKAVLLDGKKDLTAQRDGASLVINGPTDPPDSICSVVELDFIGEPVVYNPPSIESEYKIFLDTLDVNVMSGAKGATLRYTLDGTTPTSGSPEVAGPIQLAGTTVLSATLFEGGQPVSASSREVFTKVTPMPGSEVPDLKSGIQYKYFTGSWDSIPNFESLSPEHGGVMSNFSLPPERAKTDYGVQYAGYVKVPDSGVYTFYAASDDGSKLYVDDSLVVENDFEHGSLEKSGVVALAKGLHRIRVDFFQATGSDSLGVFVKAPRLEKQTIPALWLYSHQKDE